MSSQEKDVKFRGHGQLVIVNSLWKLLKPHDFSTLNNRRAVKTLIETIHPGVLVNAAVILFYAMESFSFSTLITILRT